MNTVLCVHVRVADARNTSMNELCAGNKKVLSLKVIFQAAKVPRTSDEAGLWTLLDVLGVLLVQ
jgi:hypothetical protein